MSEKRDTRIEVWVAQGLRETPWRVTDGSNTYGQFMNRDDAVDFLDLLVLGNPHLRRLA